MVAGTPGSSRRGSGVRDDVGKVIPEKGKGKVKDTPYVDFRGTRSSGYSHCPLFGPISNSDDNRVTTRTGVSGRWSRHRSRTRATQYHHLWVSVKGSKYESRCTKVDTA